VKRPSKPILGKPPPLPEQTRSNPVPQNPPPQPQPAATPPLLIQPAVQMQFYPAITQYQQVLIQQGNYQQILQHMALRSQINTPPNPSPQPNPPARKPATPTPKNKAFESRQLSDSQLLFLPNGTCVRLPNGPVEQGTSDSLILDLALPNLNHKVGPTTPARPNLRPALKPMKPAVSPQPKHIPSIPIMNMNLNTITPAISTIPEVAQTNFVTPPTLYTTHMYQNFTQFTPTTFSVNGVAGDQRFVKNRYPGFPEQRKL